jgi:hypothetical protein
MNFNIDHRDNTDRCISLESFEQNIGQDIDQDTEHEYEEFFVAKHRSSVPTENKNKPKNNNAGVQDICNKGCLASNGNGKKSKNDAAYCATRCLNNPNLGPKIGMCMKQGHNKDHSRSLKDLYDSCNNFPDKTAAARNPSYTKPIKYKGH